MTSIVHPFSLPSAREDVKPGFWRGQMLEVQRKTRHGGGGQRLPGVCTKPHRYVVTGAGARGATAAVRGAFHSGAVQHCVRKGNFTMRANVGRHPLSTQGGGVPLHLYQESPPSSWHLWQGCGARSILGTTLPLHWAGSHHWECPWGKRGLWGMPGPEQRLGCTCSVGAHPHQALPLLSNMMGRGKSP